MTKKPIVRRTSAKKAGMTDVRNTRKVKPPLAQPPTRKQLLLVGFIRDYIELHTYSPSYAEIQDYLKAKSIHAVTSALGYLERKGLIELPKRAHAFRAIKVKEQGT